MLNSVAKLDAPDTLRFSAYQALLFHTKTPQPATVPRLVLRLKYEKHLESNLLITELLLRHGNGAGLDALHTILADESLAEDLRFKASALLAAVPGVDANQDFPSQWASFLEVLRRWHERRSLLASDEALGTDLDSHLAVEIGRMIAQFRSQPLRPVDDARFVMTRLKAQHSVPALVEAAFDSDAYIREHALQSLAWMGYPVGHWRRSAGFPYLERLAPLLDHPAMRPRTLEALAADGGPEAAALIAPHTLAGSPDTRTAACDGLLQTADLDQVSLAREAAKQPFLSPEARLSLHLLIALTDTLPPAAPSASEIPEGERQRRTQWAEQRKRRPAASGN